MPAPTLKPLAKKPFSLTSRRLRMRPLVVADFKTWAATNETLLPSQNRFDPGRRPKTAMSKEVFRGIIQSRKQLWETAGIFELSLFEKRSGRLIGFIRLVCRQALKPFASLEMEINNTEWRKGYGLEAMARLSLFVFKDLRIERLISEIDVENQNSIALVRKQGYRKVTRPLQSHLRNGKLRPHLAVTISAKTWFKRKQERS